VANTLAVAWIAYRVIIINSHTASTRSVLEWLLERFRSLPEAQLFLLKVSLSMPFDRMLVISFLVHK